MRGRRSIEILVKLEDNKVPYRQYYTVLAVTRKFVCVELAYRYTMSTYLLPNYVKDGTLNVLSQ